MIWIIDGFLIFVFLLCLALGWHRGFIRTVRSFIALVLAVVLAGLISAPIADVLYDKTVKPAVSDVLETHIEGTLLPTEEELDQALENMPDLVTTLLQAVTMARSPSTSTQHTRQAAISLMSFR